MYTWKPLVKPYLITKDLKPENQETPIHFLRQWITPTTFWQYTWSTSRKGEYTIMSRATDSFGRSQPFKPMWNRKGYGYNTVYTIKVKVE